MLGLNILSVCAPSFGWINNRESKAVIYRLVVAIAYRLQVVFIKFVGTHDEYGAIDADTVELI